MTCLAQSNSLFLAPYESKTKLKNEPLENLENLEYLTPDIPNSSIYDLRKFIRYIDSLQEYNNQYHKIKTQMIVEIVNRDDFDDIIDMKDMEKYLYFIESTEGYDIELLRLKNKLVDKIIEKKKFL